MDVVDERLAELDDAVAELVALARGLPDPDVVASGEWTARDVVAHLVFWHESFARNVADLAAGRRPTQLAGTYAALAARTRAELGDVGIEALVRRLLAAQAVIRRHVRDPGVDLIPYRRGSRPYPPDEHLVVVRDHVQAHGRELARAR
ncbi:MAG TPA: maleylpyruvate isomerase N-terminal domain-containing protein [Candidatus Limnocylindrales bacterium]|nr:maleylpyruvate isomerase N-terminal domain-containing protein [Candidatus Limnocylindrales bacterium]